MKAFLPLLILCSLLSATTVLCLSYRLPTHKAKVAFISGPFGGLQASLYVDAKKQLLRIDMPFPGDDSEGTENVMLLYAPKSKTTIEYIVGQDDSIGCGMESSDNSYLFGDLMQNGTFGGMVALNETIGYRYEVVLQGPLPGRAELIVDAFTNYPISIVTKDFGVGLKVLSAEALSPVESDQMLTIPKGISCDSGKMKRYNKY